MKLTEKEEKARIKNVKQQKPRAKYVSSLTPSKSCNEPLQGNMSYDSKLTDFTWKFSDPN